MKAIEILYNLSPYQIFLEELHQKESKERPDFIWTKSLKSQYSFITLELKYNKTANDYPQTAVEIKFEIKRDVVVLERVYSEEASKREKIEQWIKDNRSIDEARWHIEPNNTWYHDQTITAYINIADEIAQETAHCSAGDNYSPGNFSEIKIDGTEITLSQVNWHNAKSSAHKDNYHMRKLLFTIPLVAKEVKAPAFEDNYQIGSMTISFSDNSSPQNKECGKKVVAQILQQQAGFQK